MKNLDLARAHFRRIVLLLALFSLVVNLLLLAMPLYMLQIYDRVLTSGSTDTLIWLTVIAVFLMGIYAAAEAGRRRVCTLAAEEIEEKISNKVFAGVVFCAKEVIRKTLKERMME